MSSHQCQPIFTGVPVQIAVLDSNGNHYPIGTAITNTQGKYGLTWTPNIAGNYTIYATFAGSNSYYGSSDSTYLYASAAANSTTHYNAFNNILCNISRPYAGIAAVIVVIIIIGAVLALLTLRKHP